MAAKPLEIHPSALAEMKSAVSWYLGQNETAAIKFVAELDRAIDLLIASPRRWPAITARENSFYNVFRTPLSIAKTNHRFRS